MPQILTRNNVPASQCLIAPTRKELPVPPAKCRQLVQPRRPILGCLRWRRRLCSREILQQQGPVTDSRKPSVAQIPVPREIFLRHGSRHGLMAHGSWPRSRQLGCRNPGFTTTTPSPPSQPILLGPLLSCPASTCLWLTGSRGRTTSTNGTSMWVSGFSRLCVGVASWCHVVKRQAVLVLLLPKYCLFDLLRPFRLHKALPNDFSFPFPFESSSCLVCWLACR